MDHSSTPTHAGNGRWADQRPTLLPRPQVRFEWFAEIEPSEGEWLVHEVLPRNGLACVYGAAGSGKSFLVLDLALRLATGQPVLDRRSERVGVVYIGGEGAAGLRKRIKAWRQEFADATDTTPFALVDDCMDLRSPNGADVQRLLESVEAQRFMLRELGAPLGLIAIDTFASVTPGMAENSPEGMTAAIAALKRIGDETGALVLVVHHAGKDAERGMRGHSALLGAADTVIEVGHDSDDDVHTVFLQKQKDAEGRRALAAFRRRKVTLGEDRDGVPITSAVVAYEAAIDRKSRSKKKTRLADAPLLKAVENALSRGGRSPPQHLRDQISTTATVVLRDDVRREAEQMGLSQFCVPDEPTKAERDRARRAFGRAMDGLVGQGLVGQHLVSNREGYVWRIP